MLLQSKPEVLSFYLCGHSITIINNQWQAVYLNGLGYNSVCVDGRTVYAKAKKLNRVEEYKAFKLKLMKSNRRSRGPNSLSY